MVTKSPRHASADGFNNIEGCTDSHKVSYLILWHIGLNRRDNAIHFLCSFANRKSAYSISGEIHFSDLLHMLDSQIFVGGSLVYTEKKLIFVDGFGK